MKTPFAVGLLVLVGFGLLIGFTLFLTETMHEHRAVLQAYRLVAAGVQEQMLVDSALPSRSSTATTQKQQGGGL
jgi:hypothetical protein